MPIPFLLVGAAGIAGLVGVAKGGKAISNNSKAKELIRSAQYEYENAQGRLDSQRRITSDDLERLGEAKLYAWSNSVGTFLDIFKHFKKVDVKGNINLKEKLRGQIGRADDLKKMQKNIKIQCANMAI